MSVIIRGVDIPETCYECPCWWEDGECWATSYCQAGSEYVENPMDDNEQTKRPDDCPILDFDEVMMKHYKQGRLDETAEREGRLMQSFSPD